MARTTGVNGKFVTVVYRWRWLFITVGTFSPSYMAVMEYFLIHFDIATLMRPRCDLGATPCDQMQPKSAYKMTSIWGDTVFVYNTAIYYIMKLITKLFL